MAQKSPAALAMDEIQRQLRPLLKSAGFRARGRMFNRITDDGLTQVIGFQMGPFEPPGTEGTPGLRPNLYGQFTVNLGVYVPEVATLVDAESPPPFIAEYRCHIRARLGDVGPEHRDLWWPLVVDEVLTREVRERLERDSSDFFARYCSRDRILEEFLANSGVRDVDMTPRRIICAVILLERGDRQAARSLLVAQALENLNPGHPAYVRGLAERLGLGSLDS